jgi:hypothetical protein
MRARAATIVLLVLRLTSAAGATFSSSPPSAPPHVSTPSRAELDRAIALAGSYLDNACSPDGEFVYQVEELSGHESSSYNVIRHAGAMYALGMLRRSRSDPRAGSTLVRAANYLRKNYIGPGLQPGQLIVWSKPRPGPSKAELGATGLGIVALAEARQADPRAASLKELQALGRFVLYLQRENGSFRQRYDPATGVDEQWQSLYYPGEAALGLISLYETDHSTVWLNAAGKALAYLAKSRSASSDVPPDHWASIATARLLSHCAQGECPAFHDDLIRHAVQISEKLLSLQRVQPENPALDGAFDDGGGVAPSATCIEGLLAALEFLPEEYSELRVRIQAAATRGVGFLLRAQLTSGPYEGAMPRAYVFGTPDRIPIRIDYVQHSLSAWILYENLMKHWSGA